MRKRIFYFNITYGCNNNCIFCYSHNTTHNSKVHNELSLEKFTAYLKENNISSEDRVILNGGEPLMYSSFNQMIITLKKIGCETVIFTNGRLLNKINLLNLNQNFRFVVPIHGYEELHDTITKVKGSYIETVEAMQEVKYKNTKCKLDLKVILNDGMIESEESFNKFLKALDGIYFNNAVHITKMADTIISRKNNCKSMNNNNIVAYYTNLLFNYFIKKKCKIKLLDTCIKAVEKLKNNEIDKIKYFIEVMGKDYAHEEVVHISRKLGECAKECENKEYCLSSVFDYKILEFEDGKFYENME